MSESKVRVAVRVRPLLSQEKTDGATSCVDVISASEVVVGDKQFTFDHVFGQESRQSEFYCECVSSLIDNLFEGYNATVFAYGQTGSGKTHTMGSGCFVPPSSTDDEFGVIPQAVKQIFDTIAARKCENSTNEYYLRVQFLELYGETLKDLLDPVGSAQGKKIQIRDGDMNSMQIVGAVEESVKTLNETLTALERGTLCRTTGSTAMNTHSSRSHAIFTIILEQQVRASSTDDAETEFRISKFHLVDLAGSERAKRTGASGVRLREGIDINKGLLALGNVISALGSDESTNVQEKFVNYRDSKLTRILQDSLGGNSRTLMITCVSPADSSFEETLNALRYANRARNIKNKAVINRDPASSLIASLKAEVARLKQQLNSAGVVETKTNDENSTIASSSSSLKTNENLTSLSAGIHSSNFPIPKSGQNNNVNQQFYEDEICRLNSALESETKIRRTMEERVAVLEAERRAILGDVLQNDSDNDEEDDSNHRLKTHHHVLMMENGRSPLKSLVQNHQHEEEDEGTEDEESDDESLVLLSPSGRSVPYNEVEEATNDPLEDVDDDEASRELKRKFEQSQRSLRQLASKYDATLASKQQVMRQIEEERARFEAFKTHFESKMREMNEEVRHVRQQRQQLRAKLAELEKVIPATAKTTADAALIRSQMAEKDSRLRELEDNGRQLELTRKAALEWQKKEAQVRAEIEMVKREKAELQKKMSENQKRHVQELNERRLEIAGLERERARLEHDTSLLTAQVSRDTKVIQAKSAQVAAMQKKLREAMRISTSRLSGKEASERERQQRAEIERLAALQVQREEELLALRRALAKKELAILRRNRLLEKLKLVREEELKRASSSPQNMALDELVPLGATKEDIAELENRLEALNSEILFRDRECMIALVGNSASGHHSNSTNEEEEVHEEASRDVDTEEEKVINSGSAVLSLQSMDDAKEVCRVLMAMFVEGKRENRELRKDVEKLNKALEEEAIRALVERRRTEALLLSAESAAVVVRSSSASSTASGALQHLSSPKKRMPLVDVDNGGVGTATTTTTANSANEERTQQTDGDDDDDAQSRIACLEKKLKSLQARPVEEDEEEEDDDVMINDEGGVGSTTSRRGRGSSKDFNDNTTVFARLTSPSALTGIHKYGQRERLSLQRARRSQWVIRKEQPAPLPATTISTDANEQPQQQQQQRPSHSSDDSHEGEAVGLNSSLTSSNEDDQTEQDLSVTLSSSAIQQQQQQQRGWERVAAQTTESFSHKRSSAILGTGKKKSSWRTKRSITPPKSPSVSPASFVTDQQQQQQQMKATSPRNSNNRASSSNKVPVYERLSDPRSFTGTQRHIHNQFYSSFQSE